MRILPYLTATALICLSATSHAQERAAGGPMETQMSWSMLKQIADDAKTLSIGANSRMDKTDTCSKVGKVYKPGTGCILATTDPAVLQDIKDNTANIKSNTADISKVMKCNDEGMIYDASEKGCVLAKTDPSTSVFAIRAGFDAGKSMTIEFNLATGKYKILNDNFQGSAKVSIPKLNKNIVCTEDRTVDLLTMGPWYNMPLASGKSFDKSMSFAMTQYPSCKNGLVGRMIVADDNGSNENNQYSTGAVILMKASE